MNTPKSSETEEQVIESYLYGYTTEEISKRYNVSTGYVSGVVTRLREDLESQKVSAIISFTRGYRKIKISPNDVLEASKIHSILKKFGANIDDLPRFLSEIYQKCKNEELIPSQIIQYCNQITQIQERTGLSFEELVKEYSTLAENKAKLDEDILTIKEQKLLAEEEATIALDKKDLTIADITEFNSLKEELVNNKIDYTDISKLCHILRQVKQCNYDLKQIINYLEKENNHEEQILQYQNQIKQLETQKEDQSKQNKILSNTLDGKSQLVEIIKKFEDTEIESIHLENLYGIVIDISKQHNIDKKTAITKLHDDLQNNYDVILGLETQIKSLNNEMNTKSEKLDSLDVKIENLKLKYKEEQNIISILKSLKQKINPQLILIWNSIFEKANLNPQEYEKQLNKIGSLEKTITSKQHHINILAKDKKQLEYEIETLKEDKEKLESRIRYEGNLIKKYLDENLKEVVYQTKTIHEIGIKSIKHTTQASQNGISDASKKAYEEIKGNLEKIPNLLESLGVAERKIGKIEAFVPLFNMTEKFEPVKLYPIIIAILNNLITQIQKYDKNSSLLYKIKELRDRMMDELSKIE